MPSVGPIVRELAERVESEWRRAGHAHEAFPEIASRALDDVAPFRAGGAVLLGDVARGDDQERFVGTHVSPQIVPVYFSTKICISLHAWPDEVGTPHSHSWCGAYQVLAGTSLTGEFSFVERHRVDAKLAFGTLSRTRLELLPTGTTVPVIRGEGMIHGIDYLDRLGVALSVRTNDNPTELMHGYFAPGVRAAGTTVDVDRVAAERLAAVRALAEIDPSRAERAFAKALATADPRSAFFMLLDGMRQLRGRFDVEASFEAAAPKFGAHADVVRAALDTAHREGAIRARRRHAADPDARALFAMLHMSESLDDVLALVAAWRPDDDARAFVAGTLAQMARTPAGERSSLLGTPLGSDFGPVLSAMVEDARPERVLTRLAEDFGGDAVAAIEGTVRRACETLRAVPLLRPLFAESPKGVR